MHKRTAHRWRLTAIMMAGTFFACGSFWLVQMINRSDGGVHADGLKSEPDYIVEDFSFVHMTPAGQPGYIISGDKLTHHPLDDSADVERPVVRNLSSAQPPMTINAVRAHIDQVKSQVDLIGNVDVVRPATASAQALRLRTEALTILPNEDVMKTDAAVDLKLGASTVRGTGMLANNATRQLHLGSRGQIVYPPQQAR